MPEPQRAYLASLTGEKHPQFGLKRTDETKRRMSEAAKKRRYNSEARKALSEAHKKLTDDEFVAVWGDASSLENVHVKTGLAISTLYGKASYLRRMGIQLRELPRW